MHILSMGAEVNQTNGVLIVVFLMALKINIPVFIDNYKNWVRGMAWDHQLPESQTRYCCCFVLPSESSSDICDKVFEQLAITDLKAENWFEALLAFLDHELQKDNISANYDKFNDFE